MFTLLLGAIASQSAWLLFAEGAALGATVYATGKGLKK